MLNLNKEYDQWLENYEILLIELRAAYRFKNKLKIDELSKRILSTQVQIAMCARALKKQRNTNTKSIIRPSIYPNIKIRKHTPLNFDSINRDRVK